MRVQRSAVCLWGMVLILLAAEVSPAQTFIVLHTFSGGTGGGSPQAGVVSDSAGNFYGTASTGGDFGLGVVFELSPVERGGWAQKVLHSFAGGAADGAVPRTRVTRFQGTGIDNGDLYGMTFAGGASNEGVVFKLKTDGELVVLHSFTGGADGGQPYYGGLISNSVPNLFGTTSVGGDLQCADQDGCGVVFGINKKHVLSVLRSFTFNPPGSEDGANPIGTLLRDGNNYFGTTYGGGEGGDGTVFELDAVGNEIVLHNFVGGPTDGANPFSGG